MTRQRHMALALASMFLTVGLTSCESDADKIYIDGLEPSELLATGSSLELLADNANQTAVSFVWANDSHLKLYGTVDKGIADKSLPVYALEFSLSQGFEEKLTHPVEDGIATYTVMELNTLVSQLGAKAWEPATVYVRMNTALSSNTEPKYSEVVKLTVTPYKVDYTTAKLLNSDREETTMKLYSLDTDGDGEAENKGVYCGFVGVSGWYNCYLAENDGTIWGNNGTTGTPFEMATLGTVWNLWFPGAGGCYYAEMDTKAKQWTAIHMGSLTATGDVEGELNYVKAENCWKLSFTTTADGATFGIAGTGKEYNMQTGDGDGSGEDHAVSFGPGSVKDELLFMGSEKFSVAKAGTYTIRLDLNDYGKLTYELTEGAEEVEAKAPEQLYMIGLNDVWDFAHVLKLTDEDNWIYTGVFGSTKCPYGYYFGVEKDNWDDTYKAGETDGTLSAMGKGENNIALESNGVYIWTVDLKNLTYIKTPVTAVHYAGLNDEWAMTAMAADESNANMYVANVTIAKASTYGCQIILNENWDTYVGSNEGTMAWRVNMTEDQGLEAGEYVLKVDFGTGACSLTAKSEEESKGDEGNDEGEKVEYPQTMNLYGLNGEWTFSPLTKTAEGVFEGQFTITGSTTDFKVYDTEDWGSNVQYGPNSNSETTLTTESPWAYWYAATTAGTYNIKIDLTQMTWSITPKTE